MPPVLWLSVFITTPGAVQFGIYVEKILPDSDSTQFRSEQADAARSRGIGSSWLNLQESPQIRLKSN